MNTAVVYASHYGSTEKYAQWIARELKADLYRADQLKPGGLEKYDAVIFGGGLYAGQLNGIKALKKNYPRLRDKRLFLFTVGFGNPKNPDHVRNVEESLKRQLPPEIYGKLRVFHFRGAMLYSKMRPMHRFMMRMMVSMLRRQPADKLSEDNRQTLEAYGKNLDLTDQASIEPLLRAVRQEA